MKLSFVLIILFLISGTLSGQTDTSSVETKTDLSKMVTQKDVYQQKSKNQKITAFVFLGVGTATIIAGFRMIDSSKKLDKALDGGGVVLLGMLVDLASIPFFVGSSKNKEKAMSLAIKNQLIPVEMVAQVKQCAIPALSVRWKF